MLNTSESNKKFVDITQTYTVRAIISMEEGETEEQLIERVKMHCDNNGGVESVIISGGRLSCSIAEGKPSIEDEDMYECID